MIQIRLNGEKKPVQDGISVRQLLEGYSIPIQSIVIEYNQNVLAKDQLDCTPIKEGDQIEIVHFVGGGASEEEPPAPNEVNGKKTKTKSKPSNKKLVIVESPAKAKTINKFLGNDFLVEASMGHVRDLPKSKMGIDVDHDFEPHYITMKKARERVKSLKKLAAGKHSIYLAPDPDREGEAISWHLAYIFQEDSKKNGPPPPIYRVVFNEITKNAILSAFKSPREIAMNLVNAQQARRLLDRIVGYELSPLLWRKVGRGLSAGRVQSVALRLTVDREREIRKFVPQEYWTMEATLESDQPQNRGKSFIAKLDRIDKEKADIKNKDQAITLKKEIEGLAFKIEKIEKKERNRRPQAPFTTSKIQQEAYNRLGFPAAKTMRIAQRLYEGVELGEEGAVGLITYMRTDSVNMAQSAMSELREFIVKQYGEKYLPEKPNVYRSKKGAQEAHEAIRPTSILRIPDSLKNYLEPDEFKLYDLIWKKAIASQMTPALDEHIAVTILAGDKYYFKTTGRRNLFPGFGTVYESSQEDYKKEDEKEEESKDESKEPDKEFAIEDLPELKEGEVLKLLELLGSQHFTKPPGRYNDASLVKVLEELGIGRPSTYAPTIYTLLSRDYVNRRGGALIPTELGETVCDLLVEHFPTILDVQFTANLEEELDKIEDGTADWVKVLKEFYEPFKGTVAEAREKMKDVKPKDEPTNDHCEKCNKPMIIKWGRFGRFMACSGFPECKTTKSLPTGVHCAQEGCNGELVKRMSKQRRTFYGCSNYPTCTYIVNKLPKKEEESKVSEEDKIPEGGLEI